MENDKKVVSIHGGEVVITFSPLGHRYKVEDMGMAVPDVHSVTSVTGMLDKSYVLIPWAIRLVREHVADYLGSHDGPHSNENVAMLVEAGCEQHQKKKDEAASIGSQVHAYAESYARAMAKGEEVPVYGAVDDRVAAGVYAFLTWVSTNKVEFLATERPIYHRRARYVGTVDAIALVNGKMTIIEYKTSKNIYPEHHLQLGGYALAYELEALATGEKALDAALLLRFGKEDGVFEAVSIPAWSSMGNAFLDLLNVKRCVKGIVTNK